MIDLTKILTVDGPKNQFLFSREETAFLFQMLDAAHVQGTKNNILKTGLMIRLEAALASVASPLSVPDAVSEEPEEE